MIKTVLFDVDGTLVDSNDQHALAWKDALEEEDFEFSFSQIRPLIGMGADNLLPVLIGVNDEDPVGQAIAERRGEIFREKYLPELKAFAGARALVEKVLENSLTPVIATSASKKDLQAILEVARLTDLFSLKTNSDDAENSKPDPDILLAALKKANAHAEEAVMIGDTPYDIEAAVKSEITPIGFTCGGWSAKNLIGAREIYKGPNDLLHNWSLSCLSRGLTRPHSPLIFRNKSSY